MTNETATDQMLRKDQEARQRMIFECMVEAFLNRWAPRDRYEQSQFESQLISLTRQIYHDAQESWGKRFSDLIMAMPMPLE